jgi:short-subunit dehydrogenase
MIVPKLKHLSEQTIVITGASSGIGLATAKLAAERGANVVLVARSRDALAQAVDEITQAGGKAVFAVADVGDRAALRKAADTAVERFGGFDTWVNNAGVGIFGRLAETPEADMRQLFDTNFWGMVHGCETALEHLEANGGALINVGSVASDRAFPIQGIYSASKHAVKGYTDALRAELLDKDAPVSVTLIKPASIGTPMPQHMRNYTDSEPKLPPPVYAPEEVAKTILKAAEHPTRDAYVGGSARTISLLAGLAPGLLDWLSAKFVTKAQYGELPPTPSDNLDHGEAEARVRGEHQGRIIRPSGYTAAARHPAVTAAAVASVAVGAGLFLWNRRPGPQDAAPAETLLIEETVVVVETNPQPEVLVL